MEARGRNDTTCITEMEEIDEILQSKWRQLQASPIASSESKTKIEFLISKLRERQAITYAAFKALDKYSSLEGERLDFREREEQVNRAFNDWLIAANSDSDSGIESEVGGLGEEELGIIKTYRKFRQLTRTFASKWTQLERADRKVEAELRNLNSKHAAIPGILLATHCAEDDNFRWPNTQCKRVSKAVDLAFDQIEFMTKVLTKIDCKLEELEVFFNCNSELAAMEFRH